MPDSAEQTVETLNPKGKGPVVILCEHASNHIPDRYNGLGLSPQDQVSHAAWDPGARDVALRLSHALDAPMVASCVSRLVYDCNRPPDSPGAMIKQSEQITVPGNRTLSAAARADRTAAVYTPFCTAVDHVLDARKHRGQATAIVTVHSFTRIYFDTARAVEIGILHDQDSRLADAMLAQAHVLPHRTILRNQPYGPQDGVTHSLNLHAASRGLANVMIEIRNDLLADAKGVDTLSQEVLTLLIPALADVMQVPAKHA
jgi:predicted N-formylglutamate amidohydrolase